MPNAHAQEGYEIMAPAGGLDAVAAALAGGADSVYFGAGALNMRSHSASSITLDDLPEICFIPVKLAHISPKVGGHE